jgi:hypothetical protein
MGLDDFADNLANYGHCGLHSSYVYDCVSKGCANQDIAISMQGWSSSLNHYEMLEIDVDRIGRGECGL